MMEITQRDIERDLRELGVPARGVVEVHSSLSRIGHVYGGASTVVEALLAVVGPEGTVVMSAYPLGPPLPVSDEERAGGVRWKLKILPEDSTEKTCMGAIADEFKQRPGVVCGSGIHRVCACGNDADALAAKGYQHLVDADGWVLLLGVGIDRCSSMHLGERVAVPEEIEDYGAIPEGIRSQYPPDICLGGREPPGDAWGKVLSEVDRRGLVRRGNVGAAECMLFRIRPLLTIYGEWRRTDPYGLYEVDPGGSTGSAR